jgi:mono/diheme cytochrome c family protein
LGLLAGCFLLGTSTYFYLGSGRAPVSAIDADLPLEKLVIDTALRRQSAHSLRLQSPIAATDSNLQAGAKIYVQQCAVCHGTRNGPLTKIASGMYPPPPQLFHGEAVTRDPLGETYWKIAYGVRLTGMPSFRGLLSDTELWELTLLLEKARNLPPAVAAELDRTSPSSGTPETGRTGQSPH